MEKILSSVKVQRQKKISKNTNIFHFRIVTVISAKRENDDLELFNDFFMSLFSLSYITNVFKREDKSTLYKQWFITKFGIG